MDVSHRFKLALSDLARRSGLRAAAGLFALLGAAYLLAALWSLLARDLEWGPTIASTVLGVLCLAVTGVLFLITRNTRYKMPTGEDVKQEISARATLAGDKAVNSVKARLKNARQGTVQKATNFLHTARYKADTAAEKLDEGAEKVKATPAPELAAEAAERIGLDPETVRAGIAQAAQSYEKFKTMRSAPAIGLVGAFALGMAIASRLSAGADDEEA